MPELTRAVGLGLASRGDVRECVEWAQQAEAAGLESVWLHDSYFERDPVTFLSSMAYATHDVKLGAGALNPYTRHPFVVASTLAGLDDLAPARFALALGSGLPLRLAQMAIPHEDAVQRVSECIDQARSLWRGERLVLNSKVPPLVPMFQPPHRIPIYIAAYTRPYLALAGEKADGYLARPMESLPAFSLMRRRVLDSAAEHGRDAAEIDFRGYLLCLVEDSRQAALNRAKREPFVIYMISILSDVSMKRAGFPVELRTKVNERWRAEDYHGAAQMIPDDLLDAFILVGTREDVAARAAEYANAGMDVPLIQPILQEEAHVHAAIESAVLYATEGRTADARRTSRLHSDDGATAAEQRERALPRLRRQLAGYYEIVRPFSFTASVLPIATGGVVAWTQGHFNWLLWLLAFIGGVSLHAGTNVINEIYDVRHGIDSITSPRASHAIVKGAVKERGAFALAFSFFALTALIGLALVYERGLPMLLLGVIGLVSGYFYTAPPVHYKYRAMGVPLVFLLMGPLMTLGGYFAASGRFDWAAVAVSVPLGFLVAAILHGNEWRDVSEDTRLGFTTLSAQIGKMNAHWLYVGLVLGAYIAVAIGVMFDVVPRFALLTILSLPAAVWVLRAAERGSRGSLREIAMIDLMTARLHSSFGVLLLAGLVVNRLLPQI